MRYCERCGSLAWDGTGPCPACGANPVPLGGREPDLRSAMLLVCGGRPTLLNDFGALRSALADACPSLLNDGMLAAALETALPHMRDGEGYVRIMLTEGRHPYPQPLVDEIAIALTDTLRLTTDPKGFAADPGNAWKQRTSPAGIVISDAQAAVKAGDWQKAAELYRKATAEDPQCCEAWVGCFLVSQQWTSLDDVEPAVRSRIQSATASCPRVRAQSPAKEAWIASARAEGLEAEARSIADSLMPDQSVPGDAAPLRSLRQAVSNLFASSGEWSQALKCADASMAARLSGTQNRAVSLVDDAIATVESASKTGAAALDGSWTEVAPKANEKLGQVREDKRREATRAVTRLAGEVLGLIHDIDGLAVQIPSALEGVKASLDVLRPQRDEKKKALSSLEQQLEAQKNNVPKGSSGTSGGSGCLIMIVYYLIWNFLLLPLLRPALQSGGLGFTTIMVALFFAGLFFVPPLVTALIDNKHSKDEKEAKQRLEETSSRVTSTRNELKTLNVQISDLEKQRSSLQQLADEEAKRVDSRAALTSYCTKVQQNVASFDCQTAQAKLTRDKGDLVIYRDGLRFALKA